MNAKEPSQKHVTESPDRRAFFRNPLCLDARHGMLIPAQIKARTDPGLEKLVVALASGLAGAYVQMRRKEAALLPGVAIGVSLVPPLSAAGLLLYFEESSGATSRLPTVVSFATPG